MTDVADNQTPPADGVQAPAEGGEPAPTAGAAEPQIPKYRVDELSAQVKQLREELRYKDDLIGRVAASQQHQQQSAEEYSAEDLGVDEQVLKVAKLVADKEISKREAKYNNQIGFLANKIEETQFLNAHGKEANKYLDAVKEFRQRHAQVTGSFIDMDTAYKTIKYDELMRTAKSVVSQQPPAQPAQAAGTPAKPVSHPTAGASQVASGHANPTTQPTSEIDEAALEEMEARLEKELDGATF